MRFDDSLKTVLAADTSTVLGAGAAFRQLADLIARRRVPPQPELIARLTALRGEVPTGIRAAVARALALADPPLVLVQLFAADRPEVAGAVLRAVRLDPEAWEPLIGDVGPFGRSVLRRREDLPPSAVRTLAHYAATDLALPSAPAVAAEPAPTRPVEPAPVAPSGGERFDIADLVHRIETFQRDRTVAPAAPPAAARTFRFETDAAGVIRWIDAAPRSALIGLSLGDGPGSPAPVVDGVAAGAFRKRAPIGNARLDVGGASALAGDWRIAAMPLFDAATGRFLGYRGHARRPQVDEIAAPVRQRGNVAQIDGLRRLVHELRTPTNAIAGFSELIESELLGPVPGQYRIRATHIREQVAGLITAIDDLELAARLDGNALELRRTRVELGPLLREVLDDLAPLLRRRRSAVLIEGDGVVAVDDHAGARLVSRLVASLVATTAPGETLTIALGAASGTSVALRITRPRALHGLDEAALLALDGTDGDLPALGDDAPLLGLGFALRLLRHLAGELGGRLAIGADDLTLTLPAALNDELDRVRSSTP